MKLQYHTHTGKYGSTFIRLSCGFCQPITKNLEGHLSSSSFLAIILVLCMLLHANIAYNYACAPDLIKLHSLQIRRHKKKLFFSFVFFCDLNFMRP